MLHNQYVLDMDQDSKLIPTDSISNLSIVVNRKQHLSSHLDDTIAILTQYGLPKTSEYYTCKGQICILDEYHQQIIQSFMQNDIKIHQLYSSSIKPPDFVSNIVQHMDVDTCSQSALRSAIRQLYTVLHLHQHMRTPRDCKPKPTTNHVDNAKLNEIKNTTTSALKRSRMDSMVRELSRSQSQIFSLQHHNDVLQEVAQNTQRKLLETEHQKSEYEQSINELQLTHTQISGKITELEDENEHLKRLVSGYTSNVMDEDDEDSEEDDETKEVEEENGLATLNDTQIANLRTFYQSIKMKPKEVNTNQDTTQTHKKTKSFWERVFSSFECIPSGD
eukprot:246258_1